MKLDRVPREISRLDVRSKPWKGRCNKRCWNAKSKRCRCKCEGVCHGASHYGRKTGITEYILREVG